MESEDTAGCALWHPTVPECNRVCTFLRTVTRQTALTGLNVLGIVEETGRKRRMVLARAPLIKSPSGWTVDGTTESISLGVVGKMAVLLACE